MISETKLNNVVVRPLVQNTTPEIDKVKGGKLLPVYNNLSFICAKRGSGKSTVVCKIALETTSKGTIFFIFSPNTKSDSSMVELVKRLTERGNIVNLYPSLMKGREDILQTITSALLEDDDEPEPSKATRGGGHLKLPTSRPEISIKGSGTNEPPRIHALEKHSGEKQEIEKFQKPKYKPKKISPEYCFVIDDLATELNRTHGGLANLCFNGRHLKASIYISFQYKTQVPPALWNQCSYIFLFKNLSREKLEEIYKCVDLHHASLDQFFELYDHATRVTDREPKPFLLCDVENGTYRRNFNKRIDYNKEE